MIAVVMALKSQTIAALCFNFEINIRNVSQAVVSFLGEPVVEVVLVLGVLLLRARRRRPGGQGHEDRDDRRRVAHALVVDDDGRLGCGRMGSTPVRPLQK